MGEAKSKKTTTAPVTTNIKPGPKPSESSSFNRNNPIKEVTYGKTQFKFVFIGLGLIALGLILMSGGWMPSPDVWDESIIYSSRRLVLAPICILAGLAVQIYAIFKV